MAKAPSQFADVTVLKYKKGEQIIKQATTAFPSASS
jgi:hypothetical protein